MKEARVAVVEGVHDGERVEHVDDVQHAGHNHRRTQQRQRDPPVDLPRPCTVDLGRFVDVVGDRVQSSDEDVCRERHRHEDPDQDHRCHGPAIIAQEVDRSAGDVQRRQDQVQRAVVVVVDHREQLGGDHQGRRPRHDDGPTHNLATKEVLGQELRDGQADQHGQGHDHHDPDHRVGQHRRQGAVVQDVLEVRGPRIAQS